MSCDVAAAAFIFLAASSGAPAPASNAAPVSISVAKEPLYADIISRAGRLKAEVEAYRKAGMGPGAAVLPGFEAFQSDITQLATLDMKGHLDLAARGIDGDLKCILRGISVDLARKLEELKAAKSWTEQSAALGEMVYLLDDNIGVITAPPAPPV
jgi:hypothetical protein